MVVAASPVRNSHRRGVALGGLRGKNVTARKNFDFVDKKGCHSDASNLLFLF